MSINMANICYVLDTVCLNNKKGYGVVELS